jgi:hypothetical protein
MSVHVTDTSGPLWLVVHDEANHQGEADPNTLSYGQNADGSDNLDLVVIACPEPGCGTVSYWPREALPPIVSSALP